MNREKQQCHRFRLIATLISMLILSIFFLGMSPMVFSVVRATIQNRKMTMGTALLQDKSQSLNGAKYKLAYLKK